MTEPTRTQQTRRRTATEHRRAVIAAGGRSLTILLPPEAAADLAAIQQRTGETITALICRLLARERDLPATEPRRPSTP